MKKKNQKYKQKKKTRIFFYILINMDSLEYFVILINNHLKNILIKKDFWYPNKGLFFNILIKQEFFIFW